MEKNKALEPSVFPILLLIALIGGLVVTISDHFLGNMAVSVLFGTVAMLIVLYTSRAAHVARRIFASASHESTSQEQTRRIDQTEEANTGQTERASSGARPLMVMLLTVAILSLLYLLTGLNQGLEWIQDFAAHVQKLLGTHIPQLEAILQRLGKYDHR